MRRTPGEALKASSGVPLCLAYVWRLVTYRLSATVFSYFGLWRAGYMDVTINNFVMRYGMHDIEEEVKTNPKKYTDIQKYEMNKYLGTNVEF